MWRADDPAFGQRESASSRTTSRTPTFGSRWGPASSTHRRRAFRGCALDRELLFGVARGAPETEHLRVKRAGRWIHPSGFLYRRQPGTFRGACAARPRRVFRDLPEPSDRSRSTPSGGYRADRKRSSLRVAGGPDRRITDFRVGASIGLLGARRSRDFAFPIPLGRCGTPVRSWSRRGKDGTSPSSASRAAGIGTCSTKSPWEHRASGKWQRFPNATDSSVEQSPEVGVQADPWRHGPDGTQRREGTPLGERTRIREEEGR